jgi:hypothetical protein
MNGTISGESHRKTKQTIGGRTSASFKRKFGGLELNLVPTLDYVYDPEAYDHYLATKGAPDND